MNANSMNRPQIDLMDLGKTILSKWKTIIIVFVIFALIGGGLALWQSKKTSPSKDIEVAALTAGMNEEEIQAVNDAAKIISSYRDMYARQKEYNKNSIYQRLDPYAIKTLVLTYYVDNHFQISYPVISENNDLIAIIQTYVSVLEQEDLYNQMSEKVDNSIAPAYYREVVTVDTEDAVNGIFSITVYAHESDVLKEIGEFIKTSLENKTNDIQEAYGSVDLTLTGEIYKDTISTEVSNSQQENLEKMTTISKAIVTEESSFSGDQLAYLKALVHEDNILKVSFVKYIATSALIGIILIVFCYVLQYLLSSTVKTKDECETILDASSLGDADDIISTRIGILAKKNSAKTIAIIANANDGISDLANKVIDSFDSDIEIKIIDSIDKSDAVSDLASSDFAIIAVKTKKTNRKQLINEVLLCRDYGIPVFGGIIK